MIIGKINPTRFLFATVIGLILMFSNVFPAMAIGATKSDPTEGTVRLQKIQKRADRLAKSDNPAPSMEESQAKTNKGLNAVQGAADKDKMLSSSDAQNATTVREEVGSFLEDLTGKN